MRCCPDRRSASALNVTGASPQRSKASLQPKRCVWGGSYGHTPLLGTVADSGGGDISFLEWARKRNLSSKPRIGARIPSAGRAALD